MAADPFIKTGYKDSLLFNPNTGVIKYGAYEFLADQVGAPATKQSFNFADYKKSIIPTGSNPINNQYLNMTDAQLRQQFATDIKAGVLSPASQGVQVGAQGLYQNSGPYQRNVPTGPGQSPAPANPNRFIQQNGDVFDVTSYNIPTDIEFVNKLSQESNRLNQAAQQGNVTDPNRPAGQTGRLGKPNYSRASTILAGESGGLGGAATQLGA